MTPHCLKGLKQHATPVKDFARALFFRFSIQKRILIISDSHGSFFAHDKLVTNKVTGNIWNFWLGPKLLYSISQRGLTLSSYQALILKIIKPRIVLFCFGEIDIRTRLGTKDQVGISTDMQLDYLTQLIHFRDIFKIKDIVVLEPPPPVHTKSMNDEYPTVGTFEERVRAHNLFFEKLMLATADFGIQFLPFPNELKNQDLGLKNEFTDDGCHVNAAASYRWRLSLNLWVISNH